MKAVLVIDIPDGVFIEDCVIDYKIKESVMQKVVTGGIKRLRPLPQREETNGHEPFEVFMYREGWNRCLEAIEGETE